MARRNRERTYFSGFDRPESNFFRMPNSWTDITAEIDNIAELKVVEYILRHTWGYQEYDIKKHITIDEFVHGRRRQDGSRMDKGTGLSERAVYDGLRKAVENGLVEEEVDDTDRGRVKKFYSVRMAEKLISKGLPQSLQSGVQSLQSGVQSLHPTSQTLQGRGAIIAPRTEKDTLERQKGLSNFERSPDDVFKLAHGASASSHPDQREQDEPQLLSEILHHRALSQGRSTHAVGDQPAGEEPTRPAASRRQRTRLDSDPEAREQLHAFLADFAVELGDEAPLASTITRTLNMFTAAEIPSEQWGDYLYQARGLTQEHTAQIRKLAAGDSPVRRKNKMPYFLATLEHLVGLRPDAPASAASPTDKRHIP